MSRTSNGATKTVGVLVVAYNSRATLRARVQPLAHAPWMGVAVADNASADESPGVVEDLPVGVATHAAVRPQRLARDPAHLKAARTAPSVIRSIGDTM